MSWVFRPGDVLGLLAPGLGSGSSSLPAFFPAPLSAPRVLLCHCRGATFFMLRTRLMISPYPPVPLPDFPGSADDAVLLGTGSWTPSCPGPVLSPLRIVPPPFPRPYSCHAAPSVLSGPTGQVRPDRASRSPPPVPGHRAHPLPASLAQPWPSFLSSYLLWMSSAHNVPIQTVPSPGTNDNILMLFRESAPLMPPGPFSPSPDTRRAGLLLSQPQSLLSSARQLQDVRLHAFHLLRGRGPCFLSL